MTKPDPRSSNPFAPAREKLIDRQIREAQEAGAFDGLPHQGEPLPLVDDTAAGDWALAYRMLKGASFAPPWIETDKEVRALLARRNAILERAPRSSAISRKRDEKELREVIEATPGQRADEIGDLLFAVANWSRHFRVDPEEALRLANAKFERRFRAMETLARERSWTLSSLDAAAWEALWNEVKKREKAGESSVQ